MLEDDPLLGWRLQLLEPLVGEDSTSTRFMSTAHHIEGYLQLGHVTTEVDVLQLRVERRERVEEGAQAVDLVHECVLRHEQRERQLPVPVELGIWVPVVLV